MNGRLNQYGKLLTRPREGRFPGLPVRDYQSEKSIYYCGGITFSAAMVDFWFLTWGQKKTPGEH
jgi:hypothetical protein